MMSSGRWGGVVRYGLPGLLAGLALAGWVGGQGPKAQAQGMGPAGDSHGTIAFTSAAPGTASQLLYLIDTRTQAFAVYRVDPTNPKGAGTVKLEAARHYQYDLKLSEFNNQQPSVSDIESMVSKKPQSQAR